MNITILCKVVDNFGDIGVVFRMTERLLFLKPDLQLNLIVDDLFSFNRINSSINPTLPFQISNKINVYDWNAEDICHKSFSQNDGEKLSIILECFQCGRPDWMEKILFEEKLTRTVNIIMIDYLTAEKYAEDFHCLASLTRSSKVQKVNFMPGFTEKTGGLIIDSSWEKLPVYNKSGPFLIFTYERNWDSLVEALRVSNSLNGNFKRNVFLAQGRGHDSFLEAWERSNSNLDTDGTKLEELSFLDQKDWDEVMKKCSVLFIRGEESMSRACLSGIPFVWHAYPQSDEYQLVKVQALLDRMARHFEQSSFNIVKKVWLDFNEPEYEVDCQKMKEDILDFINNINILLPGFQKFATDLRKNNDLCSNLMTFIENNYIIEQ